MLWLRALDRVEPVEVMAGNRDIWVWDFRREVLTRMTAVPPRI